MSKIDKSDLGYLGKEFQEKLIQQIVTDEKFGEQIIDIMNPNYFGDSHIREIAGVIKESYETDESIPDYSTIYSVMMDQVKTEHEKEFVIKALHRIKEAPLKGWEKTQKLGLKFCKQQELNKAVREINTIIERGNIEDYDKCEEILKQALEVGDIKDSSISVFDNITSVMDEDFRSPIPTGIAKLDELMGGGLSKGELAIALAAFGVGKTTLMTKLANSAVNHGYNVLQIFFEDMPKVIQRKHYACWTGINLSDFVVKKDEIVSRVNEIMQNEDMGELRLKKMPSDGVTIPMIKQMIKKEMSKGFKPDLILLDYIDCVQPTKVFNSEWTGEGNVMRQFETMLAELNVAGWTAVQGNRSAINADVVESDMMGGSIKKAQIGHFILSIAKTLVQKENGTANMAILKSRFGKDGIVLRDATFNNGTIQIQANENDSGTSFLEQEQIKVDENQEIATDALKAALNRRRGELDNETVDEATEN
jgi:replicative DNA helicase